MRSAAGCGTIATHDDRAGLGRELRPAIARLLGDPHAAVQHLFEEAPVFYCEPLKAYLVLRYDDVRRALDDYELAPPEARIALEALYRRLPGLKADLDQELSFKPSLNMRTFIPARDVVPMTSGLPEHDYYPRGVGGTVAASLRHSSATQEGVRRCE